jgi:hypothetical protein
MTAEINQLKRLHQLLLMQNRYREAQSISVRLEEKLKEEREASLAHYQHDYEERMRFMKNKQASQLQAFEDQSKTELEKLIQKRSQQRRLFDTRERKLEARSEIVKSGDKLWAASQMERSAVVAERGLARSLPPTKLTREELAEVEVVSVQLPPLKLKIKTHRKKGKLGGKKKKDETGEAVE